MQGAEAALRQEIVATCRRMTALGINHGTSGNVSARWRDGLLVTPSGLDYETMAPADIVFMKMDGSHEHALAPSSEWRFHRDILATRGDVNAVVHAPPTYCTALSMTGRDIPAVHYMIASAGGPTVRCAPYRTFGTEALSRQALEALEGRLACLLSNHGMIACGATLQKALWLAGELETLARQYAVALQLGTPLNVLPDEEIARVVEKFRSYGPHPKGGR
ncbi:MAG: class II aldolase/adducin family protein [Tistlia sp.]|uniref:class II aldolase/adducin family protein n=1 Tax=Tistlia sp. TaxID=3057121 RepID=UPI0034A39F0D